MTVVVVVGRNVVVVRFTSDGAVANNCGATIKLGCTLAVDIEFTD